MITVTQSAAIAGCGPQRIRRLLREKRIAGQQITPRMWLVDESSLRAWMSDPEQHRAGRRVAHDKPKK